MGDTSQKVCGMSVLQLRDDLLPLALTELLVQNHPGSLSVFLDVCGPVCLWACVCRCAFLLHVALSRCVCGSESLFALLSLG